MVHTQTYTGANRRFGERRCTGSHRRDLVRYEDKVPRRTNNDRRSILANAWDNV